MVSTPRKVIQATKIFTLNSKYAMEMSYSGMLVKLSEQAISGSYTYTYMVQYHILASVCKHPIRAT